MVAGRMRCRASPTTTTPSRGRRSSACAPSSPYTNLVYGLLPDAFTLGDLQEIYEIILGRRLDRRNFRKKILASGLLRRLRTQRRGPHRPGRALPLRAAPADGGGDAVRKGVTGDQ